MKIHSLLFLIAVPLLFLVLIACNPVNNAAPEGADIQNAEATVVAPPTEDNLSAVSNENLAIENVVEAETISTMEPTSSVTRTNETTGNSSTEPVRATFSLQNSNPSLPDDIMQEVAYYVGAGGPDDHDCFYKEAQLSWRISNFNGLSTVDSAPIVNKLDTIDILTCGWEQGEPVTVTLTYPNGQKEVNYSVFLQRTTRNIISTYGGGISLYSEIDTNVRKVFTPMPEDLTGVYTVEFEGKSQAIEMTFNVVEPENPAFFLDENTDIYLYNLVANEMVRLIALSMECPTESNSGIYGFSVGFCGWAEFKIGNDGAIIISALDIFEKNYTLVIVGEESGIVFQSLENPFRYVAKTTVFLDLYKDLNDTASIYYKILPGKHVEVLGTVYATGSEERNGEWVLVRFSDGITGWTRKDLIEPTEEIEIDPLITSTVENSEELNLTIKSPAFIPSGSFEMGVGNSATFSEDIEKPHHEVELRGYSIQRTEVTNSEYAQCVTSNVCSEPTHFSSATRENYYDNPEFADHPVIYVSYFQAADFCNWWGGRLPTEAEWEKAARYPTGYYYAWGNSPETAEIESLANFDDIVGDTVAVDSYISGMTVLGLLQMHGNVWEWTSDWFAPDYYAFSPSENPMGPESGTEKVVRGGSWSTDIRFLSFTNRFSREPEQGYDNVGFRCIISEFQQD